MSKKYILKCFNTEEEACNFLNNLEEESQDKTSYTGYSSTYTIIAFYRKEEKVVLVYKVE